jgi:MerR family transcriptional regulator, mercuric resistance operon regulatory protein
MLVWADVMQPMMIGALAAAAGVKITTIRYYERAGLLPSPARGRGQHRTYTRDHLARLLFICRARELEFSLKDIHKLIVLCDANSPKCHEIQRLAEDHLHTLRKKVAALTHREAVLSDAVAQCSAEAGTNCPVLTLLQADQAASHPTAGLTRPPQ